MKLRKWHFKVLTTVVMVASGCLIASELVTETTTKEWLLAVGGVCITSSLVGVLYIMDHLMFQVSELRKKIGTSDK